MTGVSLPAREYEILWRYFDGVSGALAARLTEGFPPKEDNLTFLLMELLDEGRTARHLLQYPLARAKEDLAAGDTGLTLDLKFETSAHSTHVESRYSGADLGVVFVHEHPLLGHYERGVLLQAKKLFPSGNAFTYDFNAEYRQFDFDQFELLRAVCAAFSAYNSAFYLWYNPSASAFGGDAPSLIRSLEATRADWSAARGRWHPLLEDLIEMGWPYQGRVQPSSAEQDEADREWRSQQPALRVSSLDALEDDVKARAKPRVAGLYRRRCEWTRRGSGRWAFEPFAYLMMQGLLNDPVGNDSGEWLRLARGQKVDWPKSGTSGSANADVSLPDVPPVPAATITITLGTSIHWG